MVKRGPYINIWGEPQIAENVRVGAYTEIGDDVIIEEDVIIGAMCFIPPKVRIGKGAWIGPRVVFTNDKNPPSPELLITVVEPGVIIGAGAVILPGIFLGRNCRVGAGSVVTKSVPQGVTVVGNPARNILFKHDKLDELLKHAQETEDRFLGSWQDGCR